MSETTEPDKKRDHKNYFPRPMRFVDFNGNSYEDAIHVPSLKTFDSDTKTIVLKESFYATREDFDNGKPPISERDGGVVYIIYRGEQFDAFIAVNPAIIAQNAQLIHDNFDKQKTVPSLSGEMKSFFSDAGEVIMPEAMRGKK